MLRAAAALPIVEPVARRFRWSPRIEALANKVCDGIAAATGEPPAMLSREAEYRMPGWTDCWGPVSCVISR